MVLLYKKYAPVKTNIVATIILTGLPIKKRGKDNTIIEIGTYSFENNVSFLAS